MYLAMFTAASMKRSLHTLGCGLEDQAEDPRIRRLSIRSPES